MYDAAMNKVTTLGYGVNAGIGPVEAIGNTKLTKDATAFDALYQAVYGVNAIRDRLENLSVRFFGPEPESDSCNGVPRNSGLINDVAHTADSLQSAVGRMHDILNRIERALP